MLLPLCLKKICEINIYFKNALTKFGDYLSIANVESDAVIWPSTKTQKLAYSLDLRIEREKGISDLRQ